MKIFDDDAKKKPLNDEAEPKSNAIRIFNLMLYVGAFAFILIYLIEFLLFRFCNDQVITKSFQVVRVVVGLIWVTGWISYEIERRSQFFSKRFWGD